MPPIRMTMATRNVMHTLLDLKADRNEVYGLQVGDAAGLARGAVYPILERLHKMGWLDDRWAGEGAGAPRRHYYRLTDKGLNGVRECLNRPG